MNLVPQGVDFTIDELIRHMQSYMQKEGISAICPDTRYMVKEAGIYYMAEHIGLGAEEAEHLKIAMSERFCLEEALAIQTIPTIYLYHVLLALPKEIRDLNLVRTHIQLGKAVAMLKPASSATPAPFRENGDFVYTKIRQPKMTAIVDGAHAFTGQKLLAVLNTPERMQRFNYGGAAVRKYVDQHPTIMGASRN